MSPTLGARLFTKVNGMMIEEKIVYVGPFQPREDRPTAREIFNNVFVKNLPAEDTDDDFVKLVGEFGEVTSAVIMKVRDDGFLASHAQEHHSARHMSAYSVMFRPSSHLCLGVSVMIGRFRLQGLRLC